MNTQIDKNEVPKQGQYPSHKVVMFGTSQVGKSSILAYLDTGKFTDAASTNDVSFLVSVGLVHTICLLYMCTCIHTYCIM